MAVTGCSNPVTPAAPAAGPPSSRTAMPRPTAAPSPTTATTAPLPTPTTNPTAEPSGAAAMLPNGTRKIFGSDDFLVAYYGTAATGSLGILGERPPDATDRRLRRAARPFARSGRPVQRVYELIVTVADPQPGPDGDYSHDIPRTLVQRWIDAAHRNGALLLLDLQPGRAGFVGVAKRWEWALADPAVGLALDPEWRMGRRQVPGRSIGSVDAREINRTAAWLARLRREQSLPQKLFVLHQFRTSMITRIGAVQQREGLAMVQHVDGFGTRGQKLATYDAVARPEQFAMGFKLFYDEDRRLMVPTQVHAIRPRVRFVSYQ